MAGGGGGGGGTPLQVGVSFLIYGFLNLFLNFFNKTVLSPTDKGGWGFEFPIFYSTFHMIMSAAGSLVLMLIQRAPPPADNWWQGLPSWSQFLDYKWEMAALALCTSVNIGCNNASLVWLSLFVNQILKANAPLMTMVTSFLILRRTYAWKIVVCVLFIAVGAAFAVPFGSGNVTVVGIVLVIIATLASSTKPVVGELLMTNSDKPKLEPAKLVFYDSCMSTVFFILVEVLAPTEWLGERTASIEFMKNNPAFGLEIIAAGSLAAFGYNLSVYYFTLYASALGVMVATNLLKVAVLAVSAVVDGIHDPVNWAGMIVVFIAVFAYAYYNYAEKAEKAEKAKAAAAAKAAPPATETTKLVAP